MNPTLDSISNTLDTQLAERLRETAKLKPFGNHADGSMYLCPEVAEVLRVLIRDAYFHRLASTNSLDTLNSALHTHQGWSFEQKT